MVVTVGILIRKLHTECHRLHISEQFINTALKSLETFPKDIRGHCLKGKGKGESLRTEHG